MLCSYYLRRKFYTFSVHCLSKTFTLDLKNLGNTFAHKISFLLLRMVLSQSSSKLPYQAEFLLHLSSPTHTPPSSNDEHFLHSSLKNKLSLCTYESFCHALCFFSVTQDLVHVTSSFYCSSCMLLDLPL